MGTKATCWVWDQRLLAGADLLVMLAIADCTDDHGNFCLERDIDALAFRCRMSPGEVRASVGRAVSLGVVEIGASRFSGMPPEPPPPAPLAAPYRRAPGTSLRRQILDRDGACVHCGSTENLHIDHIEPFSRGGLTVLENLQVLCRTCNSRKSNR